MPCGVEYHSLVRAGFAECRSRSLFAIKAKAALLRAYLKKIFPCHRDRIDGRFLQCQSVFCIKRRIVNERFHFLSAGLDFTPEGDTLGWCAEYLTNEWEYYWIDFNYYKQTTDDGLEVYYVEAFQEPIKEFLDYDVMKRHLDYKGV